MGKILNFGELLLRISPDADGTWLKENRSSIYIGGAELNVASALSLWGLPSAYFTSLPQNLLTEQMVAHVDALGVDTSSILYRGDRVGIYYLHQGKDLKNAGVIYDRAGSSFASLEKEDFNWDQLFEGITWFHLSAICPALNQSAADVCEEALKQASARNIRTSIDLNYRAKLWKDGREPLQVIPHLVAHCDIVMGNLWAAETMLGIAVPAELSEGAEQTAYLRQAEDTSAQIMAQFPKCTAVANTFRFDYNQGVRYYSTLYTGGKLYCSKRFQAEKIVDKVGSGDCYMAGLIYGFCTQQEPTAIVDFATAAGFTKLFVSSDATTLNRTEIIKMAGKYEN